MTTESRPLILVRKDMDRPVSLRDLGPGRVVFYSRSNDGTTSPNEDSSGAVQLDETSCILAVADGAGGHRGGAQASSAAVRALFESVRDSLEGGASPRAAIIDGFERADERVRALGGGLTTLAVALVETRTLRFFHAGDSEGALIGQKGAIRWRTMSHSPVAYAVEAGLLDEERALIHEERHIVSNLVGTGEMRVEISPAIAMHRFDTVVLASDGVFDNLRTEEIVERVRKGPLEDAARRLAEDCLGRMHEAGPEDPSKADDLTFVLFRLRAPARPQS